MTFIDWSDPEGMLELLSEFVRDSMRECEDGERKEFLSSVLSQIHDLDRESVNSRETANQLRRIQNSIPKDFDADPVAIHINDCIVELESLME